MFRGINTKIKNLRTYSNANIKHLREFGSNAQGIREFSIMFKSSSIKFKTLQICTNKQYAKRSLCLRAVTHQNQINPLVHAPWRPYPKKVRKKQTERQRKREK